MTTFLSRPSGKFPKRLYLAVPILLLSLLGIWLIKDSQTIISEPEGSPVEPVENVRITVRELPEEQPAASPTPVAAPPQSIAVPPPPSAPAAPASLPSEVRGVVDSATQPEGFVLHISANYRRTLGFGNYADSMLALGGTFLIFDGDKIRAKADVLNAAIKPVDLKELARMSPRSREITDIALASCLEEARLRLGAGYYSVILLLPIQKDAEIQQAALRMLDASGAKASDVIRIEAEYRKDGGRLELVFTEVLLRDQPAKPVNYAIAL